MNIFILDTDPTKAATMLCNKHISKMILESAQLLCSAHPNKHAPYKRTHYNHPCAKWARASKQNYFWLLEHAYAMCREYTCRYGRRHKSQDVIEWCDDHCVELSFAEHDLTPFAQAMPHQYRQDDAVSAYREYYINEKAHFAKWPNGAIPYWWNLPV